MRDLLVAALAPLVLAAGCASNPPAPAAGSPCAAVGRLEVSGPDGGLDVTVVLHFSPPRGAALRFVDPGGTSRAELRTDGLSLRLTSREERTAWETSGTFDLLGIPLRPSSVGALLAGEPALPPGWTVRRGDDRGECVPRRLEAVSGGTRLVLTWDSVEPWGEGPVRIGPLPEGYRLTDTPPWDGRDRGGR